MRVALALVACGACLAVEARAAASPPAGHVFTVTEVKAQFRSHVGMKLVTFGAASTAEVTSLRTQPHATRRFGEFQLLVLHGRDLPRLRRLFTHGTPPDRRGVHWVPDLTGGWIAVMLFDRNLVLAWFPSYPSRDLDVRWLRLRRAIATFAPLRVT
jgi:hypothetical protein